MLLLLLSSKIIWLMVFLILSILNWTAKKSFADREKSSPFECGFDPKNSARMPFSLQFFIIAVIFVIFDVELTLILPLVLTMEISNLAYFTLTAGSIVLILLLGIYHEWKNGALEWIK